MPLISDIHTSGRSVGTRVEGLNNENEYVIGFLVAHSFRYGDELSEGDKFVNSMEFWNALVIYTNYRIQVVTSCSIKLVNMRFKRKVLHKILCDHDIHTLRSPKLV